MVLLQDGTWAMKDGTFDKEAHELQKKLHDAKKALAEAALKQIRLPANPTVEEQRIYGMPENPVEDLLNQVVLKHPKAFWIEGCERPRIKNFAVDLQTKPEYKPRASQPFNLGEFDQARVGYCVYEECMLGKRVMFDPEKHELPEWMSSLFVVDQRGKACLGVW